MTVLSIRRVALGMVLGGIIVFGLGVAAALAFRSSNVFAVGVVGVFVALAGALLGLHAPDVAGDGRR